MKIWAGIKTIKRRRIGFISPITRRILAVNILALGILVAGILYLDEYENNLIDAELSALATQAEMFAVALGEGALTETISGHYQVSNISKQMVRRLVKTTGTRARLFRRDGQIIADSRQLVGAGGIIEIEELPPAHGTISFLSKALDAFDHIINIIMPKRQFPLYVERPLQRITDYPEAVASLDGDYIKSVKAGKGDHLVLSVSVPVQRYKQVLGALMLNKGSGVIDAALYDVRWRILEVFFVTIAVTVLLSVYLSGTIARPLKRLATAAELVSRDFGRQHQIPDMSARRDEIGELATSLRDMTDALWARMDATERFAADVAHEIKNPLTSLRSAVETASRLKNPEQQAKLMNIIKEDVVRMDRLISDISDASRLDAELSRTGFEVVDMGKMLETLVNIRNNGKVRSSNLCLESVDKGNSRFLALGMDRRLAQVFENLISNAISFSPKQGRILLTLAQNRTNIFVHVDDEGPGIPKGLEDKIFERFYTERPVFEKFGTHSGLGLNISQQIVQAHEGGITASNRISIDGKVVGSRFSVYLPKVKT
jgi:two-component system sensor histidine kinase ChvG